jgi:mannose-6-phosphate isomerase-like protein (cupin superfamily)
VGDLHTCRQGPHDHTHTKETELFRVIRGFYRFRCGGDEFDAHPGAVVVMPSNIPHSFLNIGDEPGQMLVTVAPGGFEQMFFEIGKTGPQTIEAIAAIEAKFGIVNAQTTALGLT